MPAPSGESPNVAVIRRLYDAFAAKDYDAFRRLCTDDVLWIQNEGFPGGGTRRGPDEIIEHVFKSFKHDWDQWRYETEQFLDAGDTVIVLGRYTATHRATGKPMTASAAHVYELRNGLLWRYRQYADTHSIIRAMQPEG